MERKRSKKVWSVLCYQVELKEFKEVTDSLLYPSAVSEAAVSADPAHHSIYDFWIQAVENGLVDLVVSDDELLDPSATSPRYLNAKVIMKAFAVLACSLALLLSALSL